MFSLDLGSKKGSYPKVTREILLGTLVQPRREWASRRQNFGRQRRKASSKESSARNKLPPFPYSPIIAYLAENSPNLRSAVEVRGLGNPNF